MPGGEETQHLHPLWTPLLLGVHHRVVQHEGQLQSSSAVTGHKVAAGGAATLWPAGAMERETTALLAILPTVGVSPVQTERRYQVETMHIV